MGELSYQYMVALSNSRTRPQRRPSINNATAMPKDPKPLFLIMCQKEKKASLQAKLAERGTEPCLLVVVDR